LRIVPGVEMKPPSLETHKGGLYTGDL